MERLRVSIHAPARGATDATKVPFNRLLFQFTRPRGARRPARGRRRRSTRGFNSRAREGRDLSSTDFVDAGQLCFNSRAREGRDALVAVQAAADRLVSIHAPARGATRTCRDRPASPRCFNSRAREGRDIPVLCGGSGRRSVSIHAPARGATRRRWRSCWSSGRFNSRAREGRDRPRTTPAASIPRFNSRAREGRDRSIGRGPDCSRVSIHAPARGATPLRGADPPLPSVSIHAPARGATYFNRLWTTMSWFQFTRPRGARLFAETRFKCNDGVSIHAPARGATRSRSPPTPTPTRFNSRAREGRDADTAAATAADVSFQFTRPRGARPCGVPDGH